MHGGCVCAGEWACTGTACLLGGALAQGLCVLAQRCACTRAGCAFAHGSVLARGRAHLHSTAGTLVRERVLAWGCVLAQTCACARAECAFAHGRVLVRGLCVLTGAVCPCTRAVCSHQGPAHTLPLQPVRSLAQGLARGQDTCPCPRSSGDTLARTRLPLHMRGGWAPAAVLTRGGVRPSHGDVRGDWGGQRWPFAEWDLLHKCAQEGVHAHRGVHALSASVQTHRCACMRAHVCTCSQACARVCALANVCARVCALANVCAHACKCACVLCARVHAPQGGLRPAGGAHRIWRVSGWRGGPWWVQGWWGDMVMGCPGAMVMGRWGARVVG